VLLLFTQNAETALDSWLQLCSLGRVPSRQPPRKLSDAGARAAAATVWKTPPAVSTCCAVAQLPLVLSFDVHVRAWVGYIMQSWLLLPRQNFIMSLAAGLH
jgi:hypothetical protein